MKVLFYYILIDAGTFFNNYTFKVDKICLLAALLKVDKPSITFASLQICVIDIFLLFLLIRNTCS